MTTTHLATRAQPFLEYLEAWYDQLAPLKLSDLITGKPESVAIISIDVINGFCVSGPLASERVGRIARPVAELFQRGYQQGIRNFVLTQDTHDPQTPEFAVFPPHCVRGSDESEAVDQLKELPFYDTITIIEKNSINSYIRTGLAAWMAAHPELTSFIVVGDCSDLCTYQAAMHLSLIHI